MRKGLWDLYEDGLTQGSIGTFLTCREKFRLGMCEGFGRAFEGEAIEFGNVGHEALERVYGDFWDKGHPDDYSEIVEKILNRSLQIIADESEARIRQDSDIVQEATIEQLNYIVDFVGITLKHYFRHWVGDWKGAVKWKSLERVFKIPVTLPSGKIIFVRGKIDGEFESRSGKDYLFETKTKGQFTDDKILSIMSMDLQIKVYLWAMWKLNGVFPSGVIYNVIRRSQLRKGASQTNKQFLERVEDDIMLRSGFYFARYSAIVSPDEILEFDEEIRSILADIEEWYLGEGMHYKNRTSCIGQYNCQLLGVCSENTTKGLIKRSTVYPELTERIPIGDK